MTECGRCGRVLTNPASLAMGVGSTCARILGLTPPATPRARRDRGGEAVQQLLAFAKQDNETEGAGMQTTGKKISAATVARMQAVDVAELRARLLAALRRRAVRA